MPKQDELGGMEGPGIAPIRIQEIDDLAEAYVKERDKRIRQTPREVDAKKALIAALHDYESKGEIQRDPEGVLRYEFEGLILELRFTEEKLRVRKADDEDDD